MAGDDALLSMTGISKAFNGVPALREAAFEVRRGEVHALIGQNGAGKSTMIKILTGVYDRDEKPRPVVSLDEIKKTKGLENMALVRLGRLSVQPVTKAEYDTVRRLAATTAIQVRNAARAGIGNSTATTPAPVATPLPPRKRR